MEKDAKKVQLGRRLRELREAKGMSRKDLAEVVNLSERAVVQWELGEREPGWFNIVALAGALGVDCTAFQVEDAGPADELPRPRGRPRKADAGQTDASADLPPAQSKPHVRKPRRPRGG